MKIGDCDDEVNAEDQYNGIAESDELDETGDDPAGFDRKHPPGFQATVAQMEAAFIAGTKKAAEEDDRDEDDDEERGKSSLKTGQAARREREARLPRFMTSERFFGDAIHDKIAFDFRFYLIDRVGVIQSTFEGDASTSDLGYYVCPLFTVVGDAIDPHTGQECLAIQFRDRFKRVRDLLIPRSLVAEGGAKLAAFLAASGFDAPPGKKLRERLQLLLHSLHGPRVEIANRTGWHGDVFVLPDRIIGDTGSARIICDLPRNLKITARGSLKGWQRYVASPARNQSRLQLALSTAFASPLLHFAPSITPTMVHFFGPSSIGKSTAAIAAGSVWGGAEDDSLGYSESWNGTLNAHMAKAAARSGTLYSLDEMRTGENVQKMAYTISSGQARGRLDKSANLRHEERFGVFSLSTGEVTFEEMERIGNSRAQTFDGAEMRLPSIPADAGAGLGLFDEVPDKGTLKGTDNRAAQLADFIQCASREDYGWAGPLFVERLLEHIDSLEEGEKDFSTQLGIAISKFVRTLDLETGADDAVKRLARTFGLIAAAGQLASDFDIVPIPADEMAAGVRKCFQDWLASRGGARSKTAATALIALRDYISKNMGRLVPIGDVANSQPSSVSGYRKGGEVFYLTPGSWKEVMASAPRAKLVEELDKHGLLIRQKSAGKTRTDTVVKKLPGGLCVRVYAISGRILEIDDFGKLSDTQDGPVSEDDDGETVVSFEARRAARTLRASSKSTVH